MLSSTFVCFRLTSSNGSIRSPFRVSRASSALTHLRTERKDPDPPQYKRGTPFCPTNRSPDVSRSHSFHEEKEEQAAPFRVEKKGIR